MKILAIEPWGCIINDLHREHLNDPDVGRALLESLEKHQLLIINNFDRNLQSIQALYHHFGRPCPHYKTDLAHPSDPNITFVSSMMYKDRPVGLYPQAYAWHSDGLWMEPPGHTTIFAARKIPEGSDGDTLFANTRWAYQDLSADIKIFLQDKIGLYSEDRDIQTHPSSTMRWWPLVTTSWLTGEASLLQPGDRIKKIAGLNDRDTEDLLQVLSNHCVKPRYQTRIHWQADMIAIWDNLSTVHAASTQPYNRLMWRCVVGPTATFHHGQ